MGMPFFWKVLHDRNKRLNWPIGVFFIALTIYANYDILNDFIPLRLLSPLEERIGNIKKEVNPANFCFAILGDNKNDKEVFPAIITRINNDPDISFVIHTGDMVSDPLKFFYRDFLETLGVFLRKPILLIPGNHDVGNQEEDALYERAFGKQHYIFQIGDTEFVIANAQRLEFAAEQNWLRRALHQEKSKNTLVFMHIPLYDPRGADYHHSLDEQTARKLKGIFRAYDVNHIYTGHIHGYWTGKWDNIPYTITGGAGARLYSNDPAHGFHHYLKVRIEDGRISEEVIAVNGTFFSKKMNAFLADAQIEFPKAVLLSIVVFFGLWSVWRWTRQGKGPIDE